MVHFADKKISVIRVAIDDEVYTPSKQSMKETPVSLRFKLHCENKIIELEFTKIFEWNLISIDGR